MNHPEPFSSQLFQYQVQLHLDDIWKKAQYILQTLECEDWISSSQPFLSVRTSKEVKTCLEDLHVNFTIRANQMILFQDSSEQWIS